MAREPISNVDTAWLRMEDPTNLMMISGVLVFGAPMDYERLRETLEVGLLRFRRFRRRVIMPKGALGRLYWEDDPSFDMSNHLKRIELDPPGDQAVLAALAGELSSTQLDPSRPLWQFHLIESYGEGSALICRLHHSIGDGLALVHVLLSTTSLDPEGPPMYALLEPVAPPVQPRAPRMFPRIRRLVGGTRQVAGVLCREGRKVIADRSHVLELARSGAGGAMAAAVLILRPPDPKTVLKGKLGVPKQVAWSQPLALTSVKAVGRALGGTVNDVLLSAVAGGLRRYLLSQNQRVDDLNIRAIVPVNVRKPGTEFELGNKFSLVFLSLPVGIADPSERLRVLKSRMDGLKGSYEAPVAFGILNAIGMLPEQLQDVVVDMFGTKGTAVMTNVVGPRVKLYLAGAPLEGLMFWVPQSGRLGLGVSILSYDDRVWVGVITDQGLTPDPEAILSGFHAEYDALLDLAHKAPPKLSSKEMLVLLDRALETLDGIAEGQDTAASGSSQ
jgi:diacylglycerol O-acyltransferase / wax synthase